MKHKVNNFAVLELVYGKFVVNRHCAYQADVLIKTGYPHIEAELTKILQIVRSLPDRSVIVDAGANVGLVSVPLAQEIRAKGGVVHAFEVQRMLFYALCGSAALNDLDNLHVHNQALGAAAGKVSAGRHPITERLQDFGLYSLTSPSSAVVREDVAVTAIDALGLPRLDFLKIDVEGMELEVLEGAQNVIGQFLPWCWVEYWKVDSAGIKAKFPAGAYRFFPMDRLEPALRSAGSSGWPSPA